MIRIAIIKHIDCHLTAHEWHLSTDTENCATAATEMNLAVERILNDPAMTRRQAEELIVEIFRAWADHGALDTRPLQVLKNILDRFYDNGR